MSVNVSYRSTVHSYGVSRAMLVQNMKEEISRKQNLHQFKLMLGQAELLDKKPVIKYLFTTFALCYDNKKAAVEINDLNLGVTVVNPENMKVFQEKATPEMTVGGLKEKISKKLSSTQGKWTLKKDGKEIPDGDLLKTHIGVKTFTVNMQGMTVSIQYEGRNYSITMGNNMTILEFESLCCKKIGIPDDSNLRMKFNGTYLNFWDYIDDPQWVTWARDYYRDRAASLIDEMREMKRVDDNRTLETHGIEDDSLINLVFRFRKGSINMV